MNGCTTCGCNPCRCTSCPSTTLYQPTLIEPTVSGGTFTNGTFRSPSIIGGTATNQAIIGATIDCSTIGCTQPFGTDNSTLATTAYVLRALREYLPDQPPSWFCAEVANCISAAPSWFCNAIQSCLSSAPAWFCTAVNSCVSIPPQQDIWVYRSGDSMTGPLRMRNVGIIMEPPSGFPGSGFPDSWIRFPQMNVNQVFTSGIAWETPDSSQPPQSPSCPGNGKRFLDINAVWLSPPTYNGIGQTDWMIFSNGATGTPNTPCSGGPTRPGSGFVFQQWSGGSNWNIVGVISAPYVGFQVSPSILSDKRTKRDIGQIRDALQTVKQWIGIRYRDLAFDELHSGFVADDIQSITPHLVTQTGPDRMRGIKLTEMIPYLTEAIKQLDFKVEQLITRV